MLCVANPAEAAARHGRFVGRQPRQANGSFLLELERGVLVFTDPARLMRLLPGVPVPELPFMAALALTTDELAATRALLARNSVATREIGAGAIAAPLPDGLAGSICFLAAGTLAPWWEGPLNGRART